MKKLLTAATLAGCAFLSPAQADTLLGVYAGAQAWNMETDGGFGSTNDISRFNFGDETTGSLYVAFEHFVPLVPNVKVNYTNMDTSGDVVLTDDFSFGGELFPVDVPLFTDVGLKTTDIILYYELFDNDLISFDFGLNGKYVDGDFFVEETGGSLDADVQFSGVIPMLYSKAQFGLPFTGWAVYAEGSFLSFGDQTLIDYQAAVTYSLIESLAVDLTFQAGYRSTELDLEDLDDIYADLEFSGLFAGVELHF